MRDVDDARDSSPPRDPSAENLRRVLEAAAERHVAGLIRELGDALERHIESRVDEVASRIATIETSNADVFRPLSGISMRIDSVTDYMGSELTQWFQESSAPLRDQVVSGTNTLRSKLDALEARVVELHETTSVSLARSQEMMIRIEARLNSLTAERRHRECETVEPSLAPESVS